MQPINYSLMIYFQKQVKFDAFQKIERKWF